MDTPDFGRVLSDRVTSVFSKTLDIILDHPDGAVE